MSMVLALFVGGAFPANASTSYIYWINLTAGKNDISRSSGDGSNVVAQFKAGQAGNGGFDGGLVIQGNYIYWTSQNRIVRTLKDGSGSLQTILTSSENNIYGLATDANYVYWSTDATGNRGAIGRAQLDGSAPQPNFIVGTSAVLSGNDNYGIFVTSNFIYWANYSSNTIGRANIDGSNPNPSFITVPVPGGPCGVWVTNDYIYWSSWDGNKIGRSNLNGSGVNASFIATGAGSNPFYVTVAGQYIYWTNSSQHSIGRALVADGSNQQNTFINGIDYPIGIAVDGIVDEGVTITTGTAPNSKVASIPAGITSVAIPATTYLPSVSLLFSATTGSATAAVVPISNPAPTLPAPFVLSAATKIVDIQLGGAISGPVTICLDGASTDHLYHFTGGVWVELPSRSYVNGQVCGVTSSFSPFAVGAELPPPPPPMTPETAPTFTFTGAQITCTIGKYSQKSESVVYTLLVADEAVSTHFSNALLPVWLVPWAGKTIEYGKVTTTSASWDMQAAWKGKTISCITLAYANHATGSTSASVVVPN